MIPLLALINAIDIGLNLLKSLAVTVIHMIDATHKTLMVCIDLLLALLKLLDAPLESVVLLVHFTVVSLHGAQVTCSGIVTMNSISSGPQCREETAARQGSIGECGPGPRHGELGGWTSSWWRKENFGLLLSSSNCLSYRGISGEKMTMPCEVGSRTCICRLPNSRAWLGT